MARRQAVRDADGRVGIPVVGGPPGTPFDATVDGMAAVVARAGERGDRLGEFAAMYGAVTRRVRALAGEGTFEDGARMAAFVDRFAARYLDALAAAQAGRPVTRSWSVAFTAAGSWRPCVLQHLLLGMTAHIGLDLGIVAAEVASGPNGVGLDRMRPDFDGINDVLASLVPRVEAAVGELSPAIGLLDKAGGRADALAVARVLSLSRRLAWHTATELAPLTGRARADAIDRLDRLVAEQARIIAHPGLILSSVLLPIRIAERRSVAECITVLGGIDAEGR